MKKLNILLFIPAILFLQGKCFAQKAFSEAKVTYGVQLNAPGSGNSQAPGSSLVIYFKNYLTRTEMHLGAYTYTTIANSKDETATTLIDAGANKYMIKSDKTDLDKAQARYKGVTFTYPKGTRKIAGYNCEKAIGKLSDGTTFTVYYTTEIQPDNQHYNAQFAGLKGFPLEYEMLTRRNAKMTVTASEVSLSPVPSSVFDLPTSGYRELSREELETMRRRGNQ